MRELLYVNFVCVKLLYVKFFVLVRICFEGILLIDIPPKHFGSSGTSYFLWLFFFSIHGIHKLSSVFAFSHDSIFISFAPLFHGFHVHVNIFCLHHICGPVGAHASHPNLASP